MDKHEIARILREIAFFLRLRGDDPYKARAYENAGYALLSSPLAVEELVQTGRLKDVKGIGPATSAVITEIFHTGASTLLHEARGIYPASLAELEQLPGLSVKQIQRLFHQAGIRSMADLQAACREKTLLRTSGLGTKMQEKIETALGEYQRGRGYVLYGDILEEALDLKRTFELTAGSPRVELAGAVRRKLEVIDELVFVLCYDAPRAPVDLAPVFSAIPNLTHVAPHRNRVTARSPRGLPLTLAPATAKNFGITWLRMTGNDEHLHELLKRLMQNGLADWETIEQRMPGAGEEQLYGAAGLSFIPPELREGRGEIDWALGGPRPLLDAPQIQGFFHTHTTYSDGAGTVEDMIVAARDAGYRYLGISDHSQSAFYANGLKEPRIRAQWAEIDELQHKYPDIRIYKGIEADILPDGSMDYPDALLAAFDFVIASVHSRFNLPEEEQTERICRAMRNPHVTMLGHPTGRLLLSRAGYRVDLSRVIDTAARYGTIIEINGSRHRLDLDWRWVQTAKKQGVRFCINPDAHAIEEIANVAFGVNVARKAALAAADVVNTLPADEIRSAMS